MNDLASSQTLANSTSTKVHPTTSAGTKSPVASQNIANSSKAAPKANEQVMKHSQKYENKTKAPRKVKRTPKTKPTRIAQTIKTNQQMF